MPAYRAKKRIPLGREEQLAAVPATLSHLQVAKRGDRDVVYIVQGEDGGPVKIGHSTFGAVDRRLQEIQVGNPHALVVRGLYAGGYWLESALHEFFAPSKTRGEWFSVTQELLSLCPAILAPDDVPALERKIDPYLETGWLVRDGRS